MIHHVIFDMDGTLSDTAAATVPACAEIARRFRLPVPAPDAVAKAMGTASPEYWRLLWPGIGDDLLAELDPVAEAMESEFIRRQGVSILFPGIDAMLRELRAMGCTLYVASTGSREHVTVTLSTAGIDGYFARIECGEPGKVDMVSRILKDGGITPGNAVLVGDRIKDAEAARGNRLLAIGAGFGYCGPEEWPLFDHVAHTTAALVEGIKHGFA